MPRAVIVVEHPHALTALLTGPSGGVARMLAAKAVRVQNQAKINASGRPGPRVRTGRLRSSIAWELRTVNGVLVARVGTNVVYALPLETGLRNGVKYPFLGPALKAAAG